MNNQKVSISEQNRHFPFMAGISLSRGLRKFDSN